MHTCGYELVAVHAVDAPPPCQIENFGAAGPLADAALGLDCPLRLVTCRSRGAPILVHLCRVFLKVLDNIFSHILVIVSADHLLASGLLNFLQEIKHRINGLQ